MNISFGLPKREVKQKVDFMNGIATMRLTKSATKSQPNFIHFNKEAMNNMGITFDKNISNTASIGVGHDGTKILLILGVNTGTDLPIYRNTEEAGFHITSKTLTDKLIKLNGTATYDYQVDVYATTNEYTAFSLTPLYVTEEPTQQEFEQTMSADNFAKEFLEQSI